MTQGAAQSIQCCNQRRHSNTQRSRSDTDELCLLKFCSGSQRQIHCCHRAGPRNFSKRTTRVPRPKFLSQKPHSLNAAINVSAQLRGAPLSPPAASSFHLNYREEQGVCTGRRHARPRVSPSSSHPQLLHAHSAREFYLCLLW